MKRRSVQSDREYDAVVVGSGPNGLAAAVTIAQAGRSVLLIEAKETIGGGTRTQELTLPGFHHDVCAAIHPLALASPFFRFLDLSSRGLEWIQPPIPLAHPLDDDHAVLLERSLDKTAEGLGPDAGPYRQLFGPMVGKWDELVADLLRPLGPPRHPLSLMHFAPRAVRSATALGERWFKGVRARALFAGNAAHSVLPLQHLSSAAFGLMLGILGHAVGWPIAKGGSRAIADALASCFTSLGGVIRTGMPVSSLDDLPKAGALLFDIAPERLAGIAGERFPVGYRDRLKSQRHGPGVFKVDWALKGPIPWRDPNCARAGTLHVGGGPKEIAQAEQDVWRGVPAGKPFVLLTQPSLFDPGRAPAGTHTAWAYCHVPNGCKVDMTERIEAQIERFAPGFHDMIIAKHIMSPADMEEYNPNYIGGEIVGGVQDFWQLFVRPFGRWRAYSTPAEGIYICSASMPPGAGVHGMCGYLAAIRALGDVLGFSPGRPH
ncbi:MAG TPA: NAD(P)/FAD-dependent oxidoreductase [Syntrophorhabdaceae bacterium]